MRFPTNYKKKQRLHFPYSINSTLLTPVSEYKYLGSTLTRNFRWDTHVNYITAAATRKLLFLRRRLPVAPPEAKLLAYNAFIRSTIEYANVVWFPATKQNTKKLEGIQRKAIRYIFNKYKMTDSPTNLLKNAGMLSL